MKLPDFPRAVITGAASGLGRALAIDLAARNARVMILDIDESASQQTAELVKAAGGEAQVLRADVTRADDLERAAELADRLWGGTDLVVNNAGVAVAGPVGTVPLADWEFCLAANLWGVIHGCHAFVPRMKAARSGFVLNVASCAGLVSLPEMAPYNVSKAGVISLSETLNAELAPFGVHVSVLCPTFFETNLLRSFRCSSDRQRAQAEALFRRSTTTAAEVARAGLEGLENGRLVIVPQLDGAVLSSVKRWVPAFYYALLRFEQRRDLIGRFLSRRAKAVPPGDLSS